MSRGRTLFAVAAMAFALAACARPVVPPPATAEVDAREDRENPLGLPNVLLTTQENKAVRFYDDLVKGKVVLINFMFARCRRYCPLTSANLARVQAALGDRLGRDVFMYSITLDPTTDTPEVLKHYATAIGAKPGWTFLTGRVEAIEAVRRRLGVYDPDPAIDADKTQHAGIVVYGSDASGAWSAMPGLSKPERIVEAVQRVMRPVGGGA